MFLPDDLNESERRYSDSYVGYTSDDGEKRPLKIITFRRRDGETKAIGIDGISNEEIRVSVDNIDWSQPKLGVLNVGNSVVSISRVPARQWRRGISRRNTTLTRPLEREARALRLGAIRSIDNDVVIKEVFNPSYPTPEEALEKVKTFENLSCAFNSRFFFAISGKHTNIGVYYDTYRIGYVNEDDEAVLYDGAGHHFEELSQYMQCIKEGE